MSQRLYDLFAKESYSNSYDHGFWEDRDKRNHDEMVMLIVNELSECQEAHRSGDHDRSNDYISFKFAIPDNVIDDDYALWYKTYVKGCTGEELADVIIRVFDYVEGWNLSFGERVYYYTSTGNFSADLLRLVKLVIAGGETHVWAYVVSAVEQFAKDWSIDLDWHIAHKQRFNRTRPYRHNKAY